MSRAVAYVLAAVWLAAGVVSAGAVVFEMSEGVDLKPSCEAGYHAAFFGDEWRCVEGRLSEPMTAWDGVRTVWTLIFAIGLILVMISVGPRPMLGGRS